MLLKRYLVRLYFMGDHKDNYISITENILQFKWNASLVRVAFFLIQKIYAITLRIEKLKPAHANLSLDFLLVLV